VSGPRAALGACIVALSAALPGIAVASGESLQSCAAIAADTQRLACFDRLAAQSAAGKASGAVAAGAPATAAAAAALAPPPAPPPFGLRAAENPAPLEQEISAKVTGFGRHSDGKPTVALEGNGLWELDDTDPLLGVGDLVTIKRSALGSFMLTTPTKRTHRVRRLR
jgi:type VI secretion system protein VasI